MMLGGFLIRLLFWLLVTLVAYVYFGYPLLVWALSKLWPAPSVQRGNVTPTVSLIIPAYNEEKSIAQKIENSLALDYPLDKLEIIVASDGSTDATNEIVRGFVDRGVKLVALEDNQGKSTAQNTTVGCSKGEVLVFSDATSMCRSGTLRNLVSPFADPTIGCVSGRFYYQNTDESAASAGEGLYWEYEVAIRTAESRFGNLALTSGSIMGIRRDLFQELDPNMSEDLILPIRAALKGLRVVYVFDAIAEETVATTNRGLFKTKARIISKDIYGLLSCSAILNPFHHPLYAWGLVSHKLLRWLVPFYLIAILVSSIFLLDQLVYQLLVAAQVLFYGLAIAGFFWQRIAKPPWPLRIPLVYCVVNMASLIGVVRFVAGKRVGRWRPIR